MSIELHILNATGALTKHVRRIRRQFQTTSGRVRQHLPIADVDMVVHSLPQLTLAETGVGGYSPTADLSFIYLNPRHERFVHSVEVELAPTIAHELFHCVRWLGPGYGKTLGEALVSEGLALHFETVFRAQPPFYATALSDAELDLILPQARALLDEADYGHVEWFLGSSERALPKYAGYALGFRIVGRALAAFGSGAAQAWSRPAADFLDFLDEPVRDAPR